MKTTACILLLAAAGWAQQVAVPQGGSLGSSSKLSDAATLSADKLDGSHSSATPGANTVPASDSNGKLAPGWLPLPTSSSMGGVFMDADCLAGNHVSGIDAASGRLECSGDASDWSSISNRPLVFPPDTGSAAWQDLVSQLALKAPLGGAALTGATTAEQITVSGFMQVGAGAPAVNLSYLAAADPNPAGACSGGSEILKATSDGSTKRFYCNAGSWAEDVPATSALSDPGSTGVIKRTTQNATAIAGYADIVGMWTSCTAGYLKYDGSCSNISGPASKGAVGSEFLNSYDSGTGQFTAARPAWADVDKTGSSLADLSTRGFAQLTGAAAANQLPKPTTSAIGGVYSDADCPAGQHFNGIDGSSGRLKCSADAGGLSDPGANGLMKRTALNTTAAAGRSDVIALWNSCSSGYLKQDGSCDTPASESTPALSEDSTTVTSGKAIVAPEHRSSATTDQSLELPTAVSPIVSASGYGKFSFQNNKMMVSENGGMYAEVAKAGQIPSSYSAIVGMWTSCTAGYLKYDGTCSSPSGLSGMTTGAIPKATSASTVGDSALSEDASNLNSSKPMVVAGVSMLDGITPEVSPANAAAGKAKVGFKSGTPARVCFAYDGTTQPCKNLAFTDDAISAAQLPALTASALGGVKGNGTSLACSGSDKMTGFDAAGGIQCGADQTGAAGTVTGPGASADSEIALFSGTGGTALKRATGSGYVKVSNGVMQTPAAIPAGDIPAALSNTTSVNGTSIPASASLMTTSTVLAAAQEAAHTGDVTNSQGSLALSLAAPFKKRSCEIVIGGTGTGNILQSGDDAIANNSCHNKLGATQTITGVYCMADVASNTVTVNPTFGAAGGGTSILSGPLTCGSSYSYSATGTISNGSLPDGNGINAGMGGTLNAHSIHVLVVYTVPAS